MTDAEELALLKATYVKALEAQKEAVSFKDYQVDFGDGSRGKTLQNLLDFPTFLKGLKKEIDDLEYKIATGTKPSRIFQVSPIS